MIKESIRKECFIDGLSLVSKSPMLQARRKSLLCYNDTKFVIVKDSGGDRTAFKVFSYWVSTINQNTLTNSLFLSEKEDFFVYRVDEWDRNKLSKQVLERNEINDLEIISRVFFIEGNDYNKMKDVYDGFAKKIDYNFAFSMNKSEILEEKIFFDFGNYKKTIEVSNPYGNEELTKSLKLFTDEMNEMIKTAELNNLYFEFYA